MSWDSSRTSASSSLCEVSERQCSADLLADVARQAMRAGAGVRFVVHGSSMYPCIRDGDTVEVVPIAPEDIRRGHVLFCRPQDARPVVHRVVDVIRDIAGVGFVLRGDAATEGGEIVSPALVIGRVVTLEREGRRYALGGFWGWLWSRRSLRLFARWWLRARRRLGKLIDMATACLGL